MRLDGDEGLSGAGAGEGAGDDGVTYEIDLTDDGGADAAAAGVDNAATATPARVPMQQPPAASAAGDPRHAELLQRVETAERRAMEAQALAGPFQTFLAQQAAGQQPARVTREQLIYGQPTTEQLLSYLEQRENEIRAQTSQAAQLEARRGASELYARGLLTGEAMGNPDDSFDGMRAKYIEPLYQTQPYMRDVVHALFPDQPSLGEMAVGWVLRLAEHARQDPVATYRGLAQFVRGNPSAAARQVTQSLQAAADRGAHRVAPGGNSRLAAREDQPTGIRSVGSREIKGMSDAEFDRLDQQWTGGI